MGQEEVRHHVRRYVEQFPWTTRTGVLTAGAGARNGMDADSKGAPDVVLSLIVQN